MARIWSAWEEDLSSLWELAHLVPCLSWFVGDLSPIPLLLILAGLSLK